MASDTTDDVLSRLTATNRDDLRDFLKVSSRRLDAAETMKALSASILFKWRDRTRRVS